MLPLIRLRARALEALLCSVALLVNALLCHSARAADPTTADCLAASEASVKAGNRHSLRAQRSQLLMCSASSCPADIRQECVHRVDDVNGAIPTIIFDAKDADGRDLSAVRVSMDGEVLAERLEGSALSIDPGEHRFVFETPGQPAIEKRLLIREAQKERRELISFGVLKRSSAAGAAPGVQGVATPATEPGLPTQKTVALLVGGAGAVGLIVGTVLGLQSKSKHDEAARLGCTGSTCPDENAAAVSRSARSTGNGSTAAFVIGAVGLASGAALWFTARPTNASQAQLGLGFGSVQVRGAW